MLGLKVVCVTVIFINFIVLSESLKLHDKGVCEKTINSRNRGKITKHIVPICCNNYEYDPLLDQCLPLCNLGCFNGTCVGVNQCECTAPLTLVGNTCVPPTCSNCENGDCVATDDCRCHQYYIRTNNTCTPTCEYVCVNGKCSAPNKCQCDPGYESDPNNVYNCNPICEPKCVHGSCVAPNKCLCSLGYKPTGNRSVCEPECSGCENGRCDEPNKCVCLDGYERVNGTCKPKCNLCDNGDCVSPGNCQCHDGYSHSGEGCKPICVGCTNGFCSRPNHCTCNDGYQRKDTDHTICFKPCVLECYNGTCDFNGICICDRDFVMDADSKTCVPVKPIECSDSDCNSNCTVDSKECRCADGTVCILGSPEIPPENAPSIKMAGLDLTLVSIGGACLLLFILVVVVMQRLWHKRNDGKPKNEVKPHDTVMYTVPHTLIRTKPTEYEDNDTYDEEPTTETLLRREAQIP